MIGLAAELAHGLMLTIGSLIIYADPSSVGLDSFIPLWALLIYVITNLGLVAYGVVLFALLLRRRKAAIGNNILFNALSVAFLVSWFVARSPRSAPWSTRFLDSSLVATSCSRRVRNTLRLRPTEDVPPLQLLSVSSSRARAPVMHG
jgi:hypothetical protein